MPSVHRRYRKFYYYLDKVGMDAKVEKIRDLVENMYTYKYLTDFTYKWNQSLTDQVYGTYSGVRQEEFFQRYVRPFMNEAGGGRVIVIIFDAMRYECARELLDNLDLDEKCDAKMGHMLGVLPSETTLGMADLLPNKNIKVDDTLDIFVDDMHCGNSMAERQKILQSAVPKSACYEFDKILHAKQVEIRGLFQDKELVYIYQNQIDQRGESMRSDNEVFNACQEAIDDLVKPRRLQAFFADADGAKVSFPVPITADIKSADAKKRVIQEKFTLKSGKYGRNQEYFLVIADREDETKELHRYKFEIDISDMSF